MTYLGLSTAFLQKENALNTAKEIQQQPEIWQKIFEQIKQNNKEIKDYVFKALEESNKIFLMGAGTSAYIGLSLAGYYFKKTGKHSQPVATTDFVSHPDNYLNENDVLLLISFARSGNSPESVAATKLADQYSKKCFHLVITCDPEGELALYHSQNPKYLVLLPKETNDKSLAMTSSYTGMLLTGFLLADMESISTLDKDIQQLVNYGENIIKNYSAIIQEIASNNFKRAVFLGSGALYGTAVESGLKLQELTDGKVICKDDTYLGFRHGPKAVVDESTIVVYLLSNDPYVLKYEHDLVKSVAGSKKALVQIGVSETPQTDDELDFNFVLSTGGRQICEELLTVCSVLTGQMLGFFKSLNLGLSPDAPSKSGAISRVVKGVKIYPKIKTN